MQYRFTWYCTGLYTKKLWNRHWNTVMLCISIIRFLWNLYWILSLSIMTHCIWKFAIVLFGCWCSLKSHHVYVSACLPSYPLRSLKKKILYRRDCPKYFYKRCQWANFLLILIYHNFSTKCSHVCALHFLYVRIIQVVYNFFAVLWWMWAQTLHEPIKP